MTTTAHTQSPIDSATGVSVEAWAKLGAQRNGQAWRIPERDADGRITGWVLRFDDGRRPKAELGSTRGLTMAWPLPAYAGTTPVDLILVVEGASDAAAGTDLGFVTIGRPSATGGREHLRQMLRDRHVVISGENDDTGIGRSGAEKLAAELHKVVASLKLIFPPECAKDLRDWYVAPAGCTREDLLAAIRATEEYSPRDVFNCTELGNAERFVYQHGTKLRYCDPWGKWFVWDGKRWKADEERRIEALAVETVRSILNEAAKAPDREKSKALSTWAYRSETRHALAAMLDLARHKLPVTPNQLDLDPWLLNVKNGTLDLRTGELSPHRREDLITKLAPVEYHPAAECPRWLAFLDTITASNDDLGAFLQRMAGYSLTGVTRERVLFMLWGGGANGKSVFTEVMRHVLGDYAIRTPAETLLAQWGNSIPNDVARLKGARFVTVSEVEDGRRLNEARIKELTGGDTIAARFLHAEWFDFRPECKFIIATNHKPIIRGTDDAIWERIRLIPFTVTIPKAKRDLELRDRLIRDEAGGIFAWAMRGCLEWNRNGLGAPVEVEAATEEYRDAMDEVKTFLREECEDDEYALTGATILYQLYRRWAGKGAMTQKRFGDRLSELKYKQGKLSPSRRKAWKGIRVVGDPGFDSSAETGDEEGAR